jgi:hypothetical protein
MYATAKTAERCFERIEPHVAASPWLVPKVLGARRFAVGDLRGAVTAWRRLASEFPYPLVELPIEVCDQAGDPDLGHRLDEPILALRSYRGISLAHPREAARAWRRGDGERARVLAAEVIEAWGGADVEVPAVAAMRELLRAIDGQAKGGRR